MTFLIGAILTEIWPFRQLCPWIWCPLGWTSCHSGRICCPVNLDQVSSKLGTSTAAVFEQKLKTENKTQRQYSMIFHFILVWYHFAVHPPFKDNTIFLDKFHHKHKFTKKSLLLWLYPFPSSLRLLNPMSGRITLCKMTGVLWVNLLLQLFLW